MTIKTWDEHVRNPAASTDAQTMQETADFTLNLAINGGWKHVDFNALVGVPVNALHLSMALRCLSSASESIPSWKMGLNIAAAELSNAGLDPHDALVGMIPDREPDTDPLTYVPPFLPPSKCMMEFPQRNPLVSFREPRKTLWKLVVLENNRVISEVHFTTLFGELEPDPQVVWNHLMQKGWPSFADPVTFRVDFVAHTADILHFPGF